MSETLGDDYRRVTSKTSSLTVYDPEHDSSDDDSDMINYDSDGHEITPITTIKNSPSKRQVADLKNTSSESTLSYRDLELLKLVCTGADKTDPHDQDTLNYANLYSTLDSFYRTNNLYPSNFSAYNLCIYVTMLLCNYDLPTWTERLKAFIDEYSSKGELDQKYKQLKARKEILKDRFVFRFFNFWRAKTSYSILMAKNMNEIAKTKDQRSLLKESLNLWASQTEQITMDMKDAAIWHKKTLAIKYIRRLKDRTHKSISLRKLLKTYESKKYFEAWHSKKVIIQENEAKAKEMLLRKTAQITLTQWLFRTYEQRAEKNYNNYLIDKTFYSWMNYFQVITDNRQVSEELDHYFLAGKAVNCWLAKADDTNSAIRLADKIRSKNLLRKYMDRWYTYSDLTMRLNIVEKRRERQTLRICLQSWHYLTLQVLEAKRFRRYMLASSAISSWKIGAAEKVLTRVHDRTLVEEKFKQWVLQERLALFERYKSGQLIRVAFEIWLDKGAKVYKRDIRGLRRSVRMDELRLLSLGMSVWLNKTAVTARNDVKSMEFRIRILGSKVLQHMRDVSFKVKIQEEEAVSINNGKILATVFHHWQKKAITSIGERLKIANREFTEIRRKRELSNFFSLWRNCYLIVQENEKIASLSETVATRNKASELLEQWVLKTNSHIEMSNNAWQLYEEELKYRFLAKWETKYATVKELGDDAGFLSDIHDMKVQEQLYRVWRTRTFRLLSQQQTAENFYGRLQSTRFKKILKLWIANTLDQKYSNLEINSGPSTPLGSPTRSRRRESEDLPAIFETPSRVRNRTFVPATTVDRWRRLKESTPAFTPRNRTPLSKRLEILATERRA